MSFCEFHPQFQKHLSNNYGSFEEKPCPNLQEELQWGLSYRSLKKKEKEGKTIPVKKSPIDIPFKLCRERERKRKREKSKKDQVKSICTKKTARKLSLLEKSMLSQDKYMEYLSTPNQRYEEPRHKKRKKNCLIEPCSPRLVHLASPNKRRVYANWKDFYDRLPTEMLLRFEQLLYTNNCLKPRDARCYYKKLDKEKQKQIKAKKAQKTKKQQKKIKGDRKWIKDQTEKTVKAIINFIKEEPLFVLNYKQLLLSDSILNQLAKSGILKKPRRNTKKSSKATLIELSDKLALWMDTLIRFVDVQAVDSEQDIPPLTMSSVEISSDEEELSDEEEGSSGDEGPDTQKFISSHMSGLEVAVAEQGEEYGEVDLEDYLGDLTEDQLKKLIKILSNSSEEFLDRLIDPTNLPDVTYRDILYRLKELKQEFDKQPGQSLLEQLMVAWAMQNDPNEVDSSLLKNIKETAVFIEQSFKNRKPGNNLFLSCT